MLNAGIKNRYYKGKLLRTEDFICEQEYHQNSQKRFLENYVGSGIIDGLTVTQKENQRLLISKGCCIDDTGTWISMTKDKDVALDEIPGFEILEQDEAWLCLTYKEVASNKIFAAISEEKEQEEFNYIRESCALSIQPYQSPKRNIDYHDVTVIYENDSIKITQWIPKYISEYQSFSIMIVAENLSIDAHQISFTYPLQSMEIIDDQVKDVITIHGSCLLEKEKIFTYLVKKNPRQGSLNYAHFTLLNTKAKVCIDDTTYPVVNTYQKAFPIIKDIAAHLRNIIHQNKLEEPLLPFEHCVPIAYLQLEYIKDKINLVSLDQTRVNYITTTKVIKQVDDILDTYGISKQLEGPVPTVDPSEKSVIPKGLQVHSDILKIEVSGYRRNQLPVLTNEIPCTLDGLIYMSWALEKKSSVYQDNHQAKEQYFGDISMFSNIEDYKYDIACKVIESRQTFKFAIRACKGTPSRTLTLRYYAIGFDESKVKETEVPMKVTPEFIILKPGQQTYFSVIFDDLSKEERCDFMADTKDGGSILENGLYTAPTICGIYRITVTSRTSKYSMQAAVVVKEDT